MKRELLLVVGAFALNACSDAPTDPLAEFQPEVSNTTDNFQLQATGVTDVGTILQYTWTNTGAMAVVDHSTTTAVGAASVVIRDGSGTKVYEQGLEPSLNEDSAPGSAGDWTITVTLNGYSGTLNFRVQKK